MAITLVEQHRLATDMNFVTRLRQALLKVAMEVLTEGGDNYLLYQAREQLARRVLEDSIGQSKRLAYALATEAPSAEQGDISDSGMLTFVRAKWTLLAGYNPNAPSPADTGIMAAPQAPVPIELSDDLSHEEEQVIDEEVPASRGFLAFVRSKWSGLSGSNIEDTDYQDEEEA